MSIRNIIFDFGGVLIDWNPRYLYQNVFKDKSEMEFFLTNICTPQWNLKQDAGYSLSKATQELQSQFPAYHNEIELFYGDWTKMLGGEIVENTQLIKPLKAKYRMFGLTNWSAETFPVAYNRYSCLREFEGIVVSGEEKMVKPDKAIYERLLSKYSLQSTESLFIDDSISNINTANEMGFRTIHLNGTTKLKEQIVKSGIL